MTLVKNFNTKRRKREGEGETKKSEGEVEQRTGSRSKSKINGNIDICRILKKHGSRGKAAKHKRTVWLVGLLKFFRLPSIFALTPLPPSSYTHSCVHLSGITELHPLPVSTVYTCGVCSHVYLLAVGSSARFGSQS